MFKVDTIQHMLQFGGAMILALVAVLLIICGCLYLRDKAVVQSSANSASVTSPFHPGEYTVEEKQALLEALQ